MVINDAPINAGVATFGGFYNAEQRDLIVSEFNVHYDHGQ